MKRLLDIALSLSSLIVLSPLLFLLAVAIAASSGRPVLFRQVRVGRGGKPFEIFKFRSMRLDSESAGFSTSAGDPRVTPIGRFIRRTSLDELPQLFNVLGGSMSLVGPRPDVPAQRPLYSEHDWCIRHSVRPGITGLAQATRRSEATPAQRLRMDLFYARHAAIGLDLRILLRTARQVLTRGGY